MEVKIVPFWKVCDVPPPFAEVVTAFAVGLP